MCLARAQIRICKIGEGDGWYFVETDLHCKVVDLDSTQNFDFDLNGKEP